MSRPLRDTDPTKVHHISCRTRNAEILFVPIPEIVNIIGGVIAKYRQEYNIKLYSVTVMSNHYHMSVNAPLGNVSHFMENVNREIAKRINWFLGRKGSVWGRRYDDQVVVEVSDQLECLLYILTNPVKHHQVCHAKTWPGISSYWQTLGRKSAKYTFMNYSAYGKAKEKAGPGEVVRKQDFEEEYELEIEPIPFLRNLTEDERVGFLDAEIRKRTRKLNDERRREGKGYAGNKWILSQPLQGTFPKEISLSPRPSCYTKSFEAKLEFEKEENRRRQAYSIASLAYRLGNLLVSFPENCFYPPRHHVPRSYHATHT